MAYVEASLDFSDEGDIAESAFSEAVPVVRALLLEIERALDDGRRGEILREGIQVAILGAPNAGKSSLLNALAGREAAIVYDEPGTTRDVIEVSLDLDGYPFVLRDTAGIRDTASPVEQEGIRRALAAAESADLVLAIRDISDPRADTLLGAGSQNSLRDLAEKTLVLHNKIDLASQAAAASDGSDPAAIPISAKTGEGLDELKSALVAFAQEHYGLAETPLITRARHRQEIEEARRALLAFLDASEAGGATELAAEDLRIAADALARLTGRLDVEDVLGQIFSEFCIGK
jgi:tRNA modification GTPase